MDHSISGRDPRRSILRFQPWENPVSKVLPSKNPNIIELDGKIFNRKVREKIDGKNPWVCGVDFPQQTHPMIKWTDSLRIQGFADQDNSGNLIRTCGSWLHLYCDRLSITDDKKWTQQFHRYPLVMTNSLLLKMAIEIVDFPINSMAIFHSKMLVHQRVTQIFTHQTTRDKHHPIAHLLKKNIGQLGIWAPLKFNMSTQHGCQFKWFSFVQDAQTYITNLRVIYHRI